MSMIEPLDASATRRVAALLHSLDARAAGCWRVVGDRLEQVSFVAGRDLAGEVARAFSEATRSVSLGQTTLGIVRAVQSGGPTVSLASELPDDSGSGLWLRRFGATRSVAVPLLDSRGRVHAVVSLALGDGPIDADVIGRIRDDVADWILTTEVSSGPDAATTCAREPEEIPSRTKPLSPPIPLSAVARIAGLDEVDALYQGRETGFIYARDGHLNASQLASKVATLEGAEAGLVCASGMAA